MISSFLLPGQGFITKGRVLEMLPGETILSGASSKCSGDELMAHAEADVTWGVFQSAAGFFIGTQCNFCGPFSRESMYWPTRQAAQETFDNHWKQYLDDEGNWIFPDIPEMLPGERY